VRIGSASRNAYTRLRGALHDLGFDLRRSTIERTLKERGIEPAPIRGKTMPWKVFLQAHWGEIAAADVFSVEVLTAGGLVRYLALFVIDLKTRHVHVAGISCHPSGVWMAQIAKNLTDGRSDVTRVTSDADSEFVMTAPRASASIPRSGRRTRSSVLDNPRWIGETPLAASSRHSFVAHVARHQ
jgi:putative transposase